MTKRVDRGDAPELRELLDKDLQDPSKDHYTSYWSSPEKYAKYIESLQKKEAWHKSAWATDDPDFYGTPDMETAMRLAKKGWDEGVKQIQKMRGVIQALFPLAPKYKKYGIAGAYPDVPRAISGNPVNMRLPKNSRSKRRPVITLVSNMSSSWFVSHKAISNRAAVLAAVIDEIESSGFSVEVISTSLSAGHHGQGVKDCAIAVRVKEPHQPVDTVRLAFALGHASMFRRLVFADKGSEPTNEDRLGYGLGYPYEVNMEEMKEKGIYFIPSCNKCREVFEDERKAETEGLKYIMKELAEQGCPAFEDHPILKDIQETIKKTKKKLAA